VAAALCMALGSRHASVHARKPGSTPGVATKPHEADQAAGHDENSDNDDSAGLELELHEELAIGVFALPGLRTTFMADQLELEAGLTDTFSLSVSGGITHFLATSQLAAANMLSFGMGASWSVSQQLELGLNLHGAPTLTFSDVSTDPADPGTFESSLSALGGDLSAEYTPTHARHSAFALQLGVSLGLTRYGMRERFIEAESGVTSELSTDLWQGRGTLACTLSVRERTELTLAGSYYAYYGASNVGVTPVLVGGVPFEPLLYAVRPTLAQRIGRFQVAAHGQYAGYAAALGHSWNAGLEAHWSATDTFSISTEVELTQASYTDATRFALYHTSLAVTLAL